MNLKKFLKSKIKNNRLLFKQLRNLYQFYRFINLKFFSGSNKDIFSNIYLKNEWGDKDSASGTGSNLKQTETIRKEIPNLCKKYDIKSILDIPCGDFYWMKELKFKDINYIGADLVPDLINNNIKNFTKNNINFMTLDLTSNELPYADLIFCRDCLVHLSFNDIFKALKNIKQSKSKYLMTTNFLKNETNYDIATGHWRAINLCKPPFYFPHPLENILENCSEGIAKQYSDKALSIWEVKLIPD